MQHELSAEEARLAYLLFPHLGGLELDQVEDLAIWSGSWRARARRR